MTDVSEHTLLARIIERVSHSSGVDFRAYKLTTVERRIRHRMTLTGVAGLAAYEAILAADSPELGALLDAILINTTAMFRDERSFDVLRNIALPKLFARRASEGASAVRAWVVGCATGEEAYSVTMCMLDAARAYPAILPRTLATDVDRSALRLAELGHVAPQQTGGLPAELATRFLSREENDYVIAPEVMAAITCANHDILAPFAPAPAQAVVVSFDLVTCCNVLIYLERSAQEAVIERLRKSCAPGGILMFGETEAPHQDVEGVQAIVPGLPIYWVE